MNIPNTGQRRASDATTTPSQTARNTLERLCEPSLKCMPEERKELLADLGNLRLYKKSRKEQRDATALHELLATAFNKRDRAIVPVPDLPSIGTKEATDLDTAAMFKELMYIMDARDNTHLKPSHRLEGLLAQGYGGQSVLHIILDPSTYDKDSFNFDRLKPLIQFLLWLNPELPTVADSEGRPPLFGVLGCTETDTDDAGLVLDKNLKRRIVRYLCHERSKDNPDGLASQSAIKSLGMVSSDGEGTAKNHAVHLAIENDISIPQEVVEQLSELWAEEDRDMGKTRLEMLDGKGRSCLHIALTSPFSIDKISWAKTLTRLQPQLLGSMYMYTYKTEEGSKKTSLTPLQHFIEQRNKHKQEPKDTHHSQEEAADKLQPELQAADKLQPELDSLEDFLKQQCLMTFDDNAICKSIMYARNNGEPETISLLPLEWFFSLWHANGGSRQCVRSASLSRKMIRYLGSR
ncbi:hypothetical protein ABW21_db0201087 [Orbilia brochopaga]|nr:hypothetical protein ABW21_db0201087 [Drechslerella brochopaga]